jgi:hypothetical protein
MGRSATRKWKRRYPVGTAPGYFLRGARFARRQMVRSARVISGWTPDNHGAIHDVKEHLAKEVREARKKRRVA